jgi:hypothetical protein
MPIVVSRHLELGFMVLGVIASSKDTAGTMADLFQSNLTFVDEPKLATILDCVVI